MQNKQLILAFFLSLSCSNSATIAAENAGVVAQQGLKALQAKKYKEANQFFARAALLNPRDASYQYYASLSAFQAGDNKTGRAALSRLFLTQTSHSPYMNPALELQKRYGVNAHAYYALKNGMHTVWSRKQMPIKIYISNGLALPEAYRGKNLNVQQLSELQDWLRKPGAVQSLKACPGYQSGFANQVRSGLGEWNWAMQERVLTFQFVSSPADANILIFWSASFPQQGQAGQTLYMVRNTESRPVIIELRTDFSPYSSAVASQSIRNAAAHEFGHAIGIQCHSPSGSDLMTNWQHWSEGSSYHISENDKETLRALYSVAPHQTF